MLSKSNQAIIEAYKKGYKVIDSKIYNPEERGVKGYVDNYGYAVFSILFNKKSFPLRIHRL